MLLLPKDVRLSVTAGPWLLASGVLLAVGLGCGKPTNSPSAAGPPSLTSSPTVIPLTTSTAEPASTTPTGNATAATTAAPTAAPLPIEPQPLPKGTTVLHVGDSMADALGQKLHWELKKHGIKSILRAKEATYIPEWAGYKMQFRQHLAMYKPDLVIITLGGNEVAMPDPKIRIPAIRKIVEAVGDRPCLWIAAPLWDGAPHTGILKVVRENCAPCLYVDTNKLIPDLKRLGDKIHPTIPERRRWAQFMIRWMQYNLDPQGTRPWAFRKELQAPPR